MNQEIAERIALCRMKNNMTQKQLADALGIRRSTLSKIELGEQDIKSDMIIKLAEFFDVSCDYILVGNKIHKSTNSTICLHCGTKMKKMELMCDDEFVYGVGDARTVGRLMYCPQCGSIRVILEGEQ